MFLPFVQSEIIPILSKDIGEILKSGKPQSIREFFFLLVSLEKFCGSILVVLLRPFYKTQVNLEEFECLFEKRRYGEN